VELFFCKFNLRHSKHKSWLCKFLSSIKFCHCEISYRESFVRSENVCMFSIALSRRLFTTVLYRLHGDNIVAVSEEIAVPLTRSQSIINLLSEVSFLSGLGNIPAETMHDNPVYPLKETRWSMSICI